VTKPQFVTVQSKPNWSVTGLSHSTLRKPNFPESRKIVIKVEQTAMCLDLMHVFTCYETINTVSLI
jgi:hypothetical protein